MIGRFPDIMFSQIPLKGLRAIRLCPFALIGSALPFSDEGADEVYNWKGHFQEKKKGEHEICRADKGMICCIGMKP